MYVMPYRLVCLYGEVEAVNPWLGCRYAFSLGSGETRLDSVFGKNPINCSVAAIPDILPTSKKTVQVMTVARATVERYVIKPVSPLNIAKSKVGARGCAPP